jgi:hypothetical protein
MGSKGKRFLLAAGVLGSILAGAAPALAQSHGGGHSGGGGGHSSGGGHGGGGSGGHAPAGGHFGGAAHYAGGGGHFAAGAGYAHGYPAGFHGGAYATHGGYGYGHPGGYYGHGYGGYGHGYYGHGYSTGAYWRGGYWHGGFWPRAYYGLGFSWFLPVLPLAYATYWWGGIPYYYANDVYYTYDPSYEGYVATDPPPVTDGSGAPAEGAPPNVGPPPSDGAAAGQIFMYPKNGQSAEQQAQDKAECQQWAAQQAGQVAQNGSDYQRAMTACVEGRGYSAR